MNPYAAQRLKLAAEIVVRRFSRRYLELGFFDIEGVREGLLHGEPVPMFLAIETIAAAVED